MYMYVLLMYLDIVAGMIFFSYFSVKKKLRKLQDTVRTGRGCRWFQLLSLIFSNFNFYPESSLLFLRVKIFGRNWREYIVFFLHYSQEIKNCTVNIQCRVMYMFVLSYTVKYIALGEVIVYKYDVHLS